MVRPTINADPRTGDATPVARPFSMTERLREISMFFNGTDHIHQAMRKLVELFDQNKIEYVIVGGMAVNAHKYVRTTGDVDFLVRPEGLTAIRQLVTEGLLASITGRSRRFIEPTTGVQFDVLVAGMFPGSGKPGPIAFPEPSETSEPGHIISFWWD